MPPTSISALACADAQTNLTPPEYKNGPLNPAIGGPVVALANILINILLPFQLRWATDITPSVFLFFTQTIPVLLATLSGIRPGSPSLSLFDAHLSVAVSLSPVSVYITACCVLLKCFKKETYLFRKIPSPVAKRIILWLGLALPILLLSVSMITSFSTTAFINSYLCDGMTFSRYITFMAMSSLTGALDIMGYRDLWDDLSKRSGLGLVVLLNLWLGCVYMTRHREQIIQRWKTRVSEDSKFKLLKKYVLLLLYIPKAIWDITMEEHPWMFWSFLFCIHWSWVQGILNAITFTRENLSFGQVLSIFSPIPALCQFFLIILRHWRSISDFLINMPPYVSEGLCFIITGKKEWTNRREDLERDYFHWSKWRWASLLLCAFIYNGLHMFYIRSYVRGGTLPNEHEIHHSSWKPFSIILYVNGFFVCIVNIFIAVASSDYYEKLCFSPCPTDEEKRRPSSPSQGHSSCHIIRPLAFTTILLVTLVFCAGPLFSPFAALPLSQQWYWDHQCSSNHFQTEIIMYGRPTTNASSTISFFSTASQSQPRYHIYDFNVSYTHNLMVLQYLPINDTQEHSIKTMFLDVSKNQFFGCSTSFSDAFLNDNATTVDQLETICSTARGEYGEINGYLSFNITDQSSGTTHLRLEYWEYAYQNDAPNFSIRYEDTKGTLGDLLTQSALTERNKPCNLKACANSNGDTVAVLGPLSLFLSFLDDFCAFIARPKIFSLD